MTMAEPLNKKAVSFVIADGTADNGKSRDTSMRPKVGNWHFLLVHKSHHLSCMYVCLFTTSSLQAIQSIEQILT